MDWKKLLKIGTAAGGAIAPAPISKILQEVNDSINDEDDPSNSVGLTSVAKEVDDLGKAILVLHQRISKLENK